MINFVAKKLLRYYILKEYGSFVAICFGRREDRRNLWFMVHD